MCKTDTNQSALEERWGGGWNLLHKKEAGNSREVSQGGGGKPKSVSLLISLFLSAVLYLVLLKNQKSVWRKLESSDSLK